MFVQTVKIIQSHVISGKELNTVKDGKVFFAFSYNTYVSFQGSSIVIVLADINALTLWSLLHASQQLSITEPSSFPTPVVRVFKEI